MTQDFQFNVFFFSVYCYRVLNAYCCIQLFFFSSPFQGILSLLYLASSDMYALINYVGFATWLSIGMAIVSLLYLRYSRPEMPRPIKVHLVWPIIYTIVTVYLVVLPLYASPTETGKHCGSLSIGENLVSV